MKVALYLDDNGFHDLDLRFPEKGNNGVGGTQYCFLMLAYELVKNTNIEVCIYHHNTNHLPVGTVDRIVRDWEEMLSIGRGQDIFVFKADDKKARLDLMQKYNLNCVAWAHNYLLADRLKQLTSNSAIKRVVFVGKEHYDRYIDHDVINKSTYIFNMFPSKSFEARPLPNEYSVTYTGSLVDGKGFHVLAKAWKMVLKKVPNAKLYVIGNGKLYNRNSKLGPLGISDIEYEKKFAPYLLENGKLLDSVHFLGTLGNEKIDVYKKTKVGVMNPSGITETFGLSAVEMEACAIPVVTKAKNGLFDTVKDGETGYLIKNEKQLAERIAVLLRDDNLNVTLGRQAKLFVNKSFDPAVLVGKWVELFDDVIANNVAEYLRPTTNFSNNFKWLHIVVRWLRKLGIPVKPLAELDYFVRKVLRRV